jgi:parallel beta-helix repeat protein
MSKKSIALAAVFALLGVGVGVYLGKTYLGVGTAGLAESVSADSVLAAKHATDDKAVSALRDASHAGHVLTVKPGDSIQDAVRRAAPGDTIQVMPGEYRETVYIDKDNISLIGVIIDSKWPTLEGDHKLNDAVLYSGNGVRVENLKITHFKGNAIMGEAGNNFVVRHNWIVESGVYGIFPEFGKNGLIEYNVLTGIEDAAIYVGMSDNIHVAHNEVYGNVAGIEIENSRKTVVEDNLAYDNAGGILTFITPGLPIKTTSDVVIRNNFIYSNNHKNFGAVGSIVSGLPSGTGMVVMAAKDVIIENNVVRDNKNAGLIIADHQSFPNVTLDPQTDPTPARVQILNNFMTNNGYEPIPEVKALMLAALTKEGPDIVAAGAGKDNCVLSKADFHTLGLSSYTKCTRTSSADIPTYLLDAPAEPRQIGVAEKGKMIYYAVCSGCHAYNARLVGPPVIAIQALYANNAKGIAEYIGNPVKKRDDFPSMPPQSYLTPELRQAAADYMLSVSQ